MRVVGRLEVETGVGMVVVVEEEEEEEEAEVGEAEVGEVVEEGGWRCVRRPGGRLGAIG